MPRPEGDAPHKDPWNLWPLYCCPHLGVSAPVSQNQPSRPRQEMGLGNCLHFPRILRSCDFTEGPAKLGVRIRVKSEVRRSTTSSLTDSPTLSAPTIPNLSHLCQYPGTGTHLGQPQNQQVTGPQILLTAQ